MIANNKKTYLWFLLFVGAFVLSAANRGNAQLFSLSVNDLVNKKGFNWKSAETANFRFYFEAGTFAEKHIEEAQRECRAIAHKGSWASLRKDVPAPSYDLLSIEHDPGQSLSKLTVNC